MRSDGYQNNFTFPSEPACNFFFIETPVLHDHSDILFCNNSFHALQLKRSGCASSFWPRKPLMLTCNFRHWPELDKSALRSIKAGCMTELIGPLVPPMRLTFRIAGHVQIAYCFSCVTALRIRQTPDIQFQGL